jgi:hypothetical protein
LPSLMRLQNQAAGAARPSEPRRLPNIPQRGWNRTASSVRLDYSWEAPL